LRSFGVELIQRAGVLLRVPKLTTVRSAMTFQRFYYRKSFADCDVRAAAAAASLMACKLEEVPRKLEKVIMVFHRIQMRELQEDGISMFENRPTPFLDTNGKEYAEMKKDVSRAERDMFREIGFDISMRLPSAHNYALMYCNALKFPNAIIQKAWNYLNDSLRTTLCCEYLPQQIATASITLAARTLGMKLPITPKPWWEVIDADASHTKRIAAILMKAYQEPRVEYIHIPRKKKAPAAPPQTPAETPFTPHPDTPAPAMSPSRDKKGRRRRKVRSEDL